MNTENILGELKNIADEAARRNLIREATELHVFIKVAQDDDLQDDMDGNPKRSIVRYDPSDTVGMLFQNPATKTVTPPPVIPPPVSGALLAEEGALAGAGAMGISKFLPYVGGGLAAGVGLRSLYNWWTHRDKQDAEPKNPQDLFQLAQLVLALRRMSAQKPKDESIKKFLESAEHDLVEGRKSMQTNS